MPMTRSVSADGLVYLAPEGEMTIYTAAELFAELRADLLTPDALQLDLAGVSELDSAGVQLLLLAERDSRLAGKALTFIGHSQAVRDTLTLCNLNQLLAAAH